MKTSKLVITVYLLLLLFVLLLSVEMHVYREGGVSLHGE